MSLAAMPASHGASPGWHAGTYRGIQVGRSTMADVLQELGDPDAVATPEGGDDTQRDRVVWFHYDQADPKLGPLTVSIRARDARVMWMFQLPSELSIADAQAEFGREAEIVRYDTCPDFDESAPVYATPDGMIETHQYRGRGVVLEVDAGVVREIHYVSGDGYGLRSIKDCARERR